MATFKYELQPFTTRVESILGKGYYGRSPQNEIFFGGDNANKFHLMGEQGRYQPKNRNFSALNLSPVERRNIIDQSYIRNNLPVPNRGYSALGQQMNAMNLPMPSGSGKKTTGTKTPPNWRDNLLNYVLSPKGQGMAQGLLEASGYSEVPVTFGQALAMGLKRGNEAQTAADAKALAERQELMNNLLVQSQIYKNYQPSGNPQHKFRPMTKEEKLAYGIPEDTPARFNETLNKPEIMSIGSGGTSVTVVNEAESKGIIQISRKRSLKYKLHIISFKKQTI